MLPHLARPLGYCGDYFAITSLTPSLTHPRPFRFAASIMTGSSGMHGGGGGINGVKLVGLNGGGSSSADGSTASSSAGGVGAGGYYCNSYTPPAPIDHGLLSTAYSKSRLWLHR